MMTISVVVGQTNDIEPVNGNGTRHQLALPVLIICSLVGLCFLTFGNTLAGYFVADDFIPLAYMHQGFNGHFCELLSRLWRSWQDETVQLLYRPISEISLWADYLLWRSDAFGYHLTNIFWHVVSTVALYFLTSIILQRCTDATQSAVSLRRPSLPAFAAAALFATTPLHGETVAWMIGRVDSVCTSFYLLSFLFFALAPRYLWLSLAFFVLALGAKEMAVTLPAVLTIYSLIASDHKSDGSILSRLRRSAARTAPFWLSLIPYFILRTIVLGTPTGGYIGSIGDIFAETSVHRFTQTHFSKLFYPYSNYVLSRSDWPVKVLHLLYALSSLLVLFRLFVAPWSQATKKSLLFSLLWFVIAMLPAVPVWYLNGALTGGRFLYLSSTAMCMFFAVLIFGMSDTLVQDAKKYTLLRTAGVVLILAFVSCFVVIARANNGAWVEAGNEMRQFHTAIEKTLQTLPSERKLVVFDTPAQRNTEHYFYTASMLHSFLKPPFSKTDLSARVLVLQPNSYMPEDPLNVSLLRRLQDAGDCSFYRYDSKRQQFVQVSLDGSGLADVHAIDAQQPAGINTRRLIFGKSISPGVLDCLEVEIADGTSAKNIAVGWKARSDVRGEPPSINVPVRPGRRKYVFHLGQHRAWSLSHPLKAIELRSDGPIGSPLEVMPISLPVPQLAEESGSFRQRSDSFLVPQHAEMRFSFDASALDGAQGVLVELSRPNSYFVHYTRTLRDETPSPHSLRQFLARGVKGQFVVEQSSLPRPGLYQLRIFAVDGQQNIIGLASDPLSIDTRRKP